MEPELLSQIKRVLTSLEQLLPKPVAKIDWAVCHAANWRRHSFSGYLEPIRQIEDIQWDDLLGIDTQKELVEENTLQFLGGYPANNMLLWGTRGTGKSSLVRALLNKYAHKGLRVLQVDKDDLIHLPGIVDEIRDKPYKFVIFSDDASFERTDSNYKMLKSALDGAVYAPPENALIYVTSNRRHLLPEYETDKRGGMMVNNEVHQSEVTEEKASLSGRFGIWVGFHPFSQEQYLDVTRKWMEKLSLKNGASIEWTKETEAAAILWAQMKVDRSGRIAYQFASHWVGQHLLKISGMV
jgi:predicted AAA+ superfamily ATPase